MPEFPGHPLLAFLLTCAALAIVSSRTWGGDAAEIVALVNGEQVTREDLRRMLVDPGGQPPAGGNRGARDADMGERESLALRSLIRHRLLLQEAERLNLGVTEQEIDGTIAALRQRFGDLKDFGIWMKERGLDDRSLFEAVREEILQKKVMARLVEDVKVSDEQVLNYYKNYGAGLVVGEEVRLRIIAVGSGAEADGILTALREGADFDRLARRHSVGLLASHGGDTGWVDMTGLPALLHEAVSMLETGDVAGPLQKEENEFLVVGLAGRRPRHAKDPAEARSEIERRLRGMNQQEVVETWLREQEEKAKIEVFLHPGQSAVGGPEAEEAGEGDTAHEKAR